MGRYLESNQFGGFYCPYTLVVRCGRVSGIKLILAKQPPSAAFPLPKMVLNLPLYHEGSEYVISFEIGQREG